MKALMIGCGKMGGALLHQWALSDQVSFTVIDPAANALPASVTGYRHAEALGTETFDMVIIAIKPQLVEDILPVYKKHLSETGCVLSMAAGCSAERIAALLDTAAIIRIMPNLPSFIGQGVAGMFAQDAVSKAQKMQVEHMMALAGTAIWVVDEDGIDRITAVAGSGPGYVFEFARSYIEAAKSLGFSDDQARDLVLGTIVGTINMAKQSIESLETLRNNVTSKNGTTEAGLNALNGDDVLSKRLNETVKAAYERAVELR